MFDWLLSVSFVLLFIKIAKILIATSILIYQIRKFDRNKKINHITNFFFFEK
jgi:hypothetical protein